MQPIKYCALFFLIIVIGACASTGRRVFDRADGFDEKPSWCDLSADLKDSGGKLFVIGRAEFDASDSQEACLKAAAHDGRAKLAKGLSSKLDGLTQSHISKSGNEFKEVVKNRFSAQVSGTNVEKEYWEKQSIPTEHEQHETKLYCYAMVSMDFAQYRTVLRELTEASKDFGVKQVLQQEAERFLSSESLQQ